MNASHTTQIDAAVSLQTKEDMTSDIRYLRHRLKHASVSLAAQWRRYMHINVSSSLTSIIFQLPASFSSITRWLPLQRWLPLEGVLREDRLIALLPGACSQECVCGWRVHLIAGSVLPGTLAAEAAEHCREHAPRNGIPTAFP